ncbi:protein bicaudal C isoform X1 [Bradysia coprophila]|uniref:protein bicaudal C isoform X1 n=2 Tax=Bradysia coprophila TaxID=38358 RepID=UPI00187D7EFC|nr:protein bicaudal C isoform X1 [Bradysia coprophila]
MAASRLVPDMDMRFNSIRRVSESLSEASSNATELSEHDIRARLGIADSSNIYVEKLKVDRKKLEEMIQSEKAIPFFESLMSDTTTHIYWPSHLKIDAKSKKDVHVKILGKQEDTAIAKERVLEKLDVRGSRVTMKMDISYNDHSSIIGTGGNNIKKIMDETSTHIHFPDSNKESKESKDLARRTNMPYNQNPYSYIEGNNINKSFPPKSNQVSLNGTLEGVERARAAVRLTSPLSISFETPVSENQRPTHATETYIERVKEKFDVKVVSKQTRQRLHSTTVMVKGTEKDAWYTKQATKLLINCMCETFANQTKVCLQMEISIQHHDSIKGPNGSNLRQIMEETSTTIIFPDCRDGNTPQSKKSHVTIKGCIDGVYLARQQLIGNLLVTLSFDYSDSLNKEAIEALNVKYGVLISCRDKSKNTSKSIVIRGKEKFIDKIYEARHELLKLTTPLIKASIPPTYFSKLDISDEFAFRQTLALMPNRSESPLIQHHMGQPPNFVPQFDALSPTISRMSNLSIGRQRVPHNNYNGNFLSPHPNMSPRNPSPLTSGYGSGHNSFNSSGNSLDAQMSLFQQPQSNPFIDSRLPEAVASYDDEKTPTLLDVKNSFNFEQRSKAYFAMKRSLDGEEIRTPTSQWSGLGLSKTSPFSLETVRKSNDWDHNEAPAASVSSPFGLGKTTGIVDASSTNLLSAGPPKDMNTMLISLGLEHYIDTFHIHEIDLDIFATLTPENLTTLGIQAFGARKKLLMAINQLNASKLNVNRSTRFSGSAAPGAERRISGDW